MSSVNKVILLGNIGKDPEVRETKSGKVVNLVLATSERYTDKSGQKQENTEWHNLVVTSKAQAGIDPNQKGMSLGQCFGASSSYARKYALNGLLLIDDNKDPDVTNNHSTTKPRKTTTVEKKAGAKKKVVAGTAEYNKLLEWIESAKGSIEKALEMYDIDSATENLIRKSIKSK